MKERTQILRNAGISSLGTYTEYALGLVAGVWIARALGPRDYGSYAFVIWMCGLLIAASNNALPMSTIKFIAEARGGADASLPGLIARRMLWLQRLGSLAVLGGFLSWAAYMPPADWAERRWLIVGLVCAAVFAKSTFAMLVAIAKGYEQFGPEAIAVVVAGILNVLLVLWVDSRGGGIVTYIAIYVVLSAALLLIVTLIAKRRRIYPGAGSPRLPEDLNRRMTRHLALTGGLVVLSSLSARAVETMLLKATAPLEIVGFFALSGTLTKGAVDFLASGLSATLLPAMARAYGRGSHSGLDRLLPDSVRLFSALGFAIAALGSVVSPGLVDLLFGSRYAGAVVAVQVSLVAGGIGLLSAPINAYQTTADRQAQRVVITGSVLAINGIAALLLVPEFGLEGALWSLLITSVSNVAISVVALRRTSVVRLPYGACGRLALSALLAWGGAIGATELVRFRFEFVIGGLVFIVLYAAISIMVGCWSRADFQLAASLLERMGAQRAASAVKWTGQRAGSK